MKGANSLPVLAQTGLAALDYRSLQHKKRN